VQSRQRKVLQAAKDGGRQCRGDQEETRPCPAQPACRVEKGINDEDSLPALTSSNL